MELETIKPILTQNPWFKSLPESAIDLLVTLCKTKNLKKGQLLHAKNGPADGLYCVLSGRIRVSNVDSEGKEMVLTWLDAGNWFGEISLFDGLPRTHDAYADMNTQLLKLPVQEFQGLLTRHPELYPHFMVLLCQRIRATFSLIDESGSLGLEGQLAKRLLLLTGGLEHPVSHSSSREIRISQETLAQMINSSRQTVNKLLQQWRKDKVVSMGYGTVKLKNTDYLRRLCQM